MTPLHFGSDGRTAVVKTLLALGAAVDCVTNYLGYTALHKAVIGQHVDIVKYLLANCSNPNIRSKVRYCIAGNIRETKFLQMGPKMKICG